MELYTKYIYEKKWTKTSLKDALRMVSEEMPETDAQATLDYILESIKDGKSITLGECKFSMSSNQ